MTTKFNQHILIAAEDEGKKKKKDSLGQVFELMKSFTELQKQIEECLDSQEDMDARAKIEAFDKHIDDMYQTLLDLASHGVHSIRKRNNMPEDGAIPSEEPAVEPSEPMVEKSPVSVTSPSAPKAIR